MPKLNDSHFITRSFGEKSEQVIGLYQRFVANHFSLSQTQNLPGFTPRGGSSPFSGTL